MARLASDESSYLTDFNVEVTGGICVAGATTSERRRDCEPRAQPAYLVSPK